MVITLLAGRAGARFKAHRSGNDVAEGRLAEVPVTLAVEADAVVLHVMAPQAEERTVEEAVAE